MRPSGIGGQAVLEGIMMKNEEKYAVAVRKPDQMIEVCVKEHKLFTKGKKILGLPFIRGVFNFIDSLVLGMKTLIYSASFYDEEPAEEEKAADKLVNKVFQEKAESVIIGFTIFASILMAVGLFMVLPYFISDIIRSKSSVDSKSLIALLEGVIRISIFVLYIVLISKMKDIQRTFMYHGAEHKCINCIEHGLLLDIDNVRKSSRLHKRCGTSFLLIVIVISIIFFMFIRVDNPVLKVVYRLLLLPVIAGVSYEFIRLAGRTENKLVELLSKPGMWLQRLTTKEPDDGMIEVAIQAVEAVFDWEQFIEEGSEDLESVSQDGV